MSNLIPYKDDYDTAEDKGRKIYQQNQHLRKLANVMEHPEFRDFFDTYMKDWDSTKTILMFMKVYEAIEKHSSVGLSPYQKIAIVKDVIDDSEMRRKVVQGIQNWTSADTISLLNEKNRNCIE
jgi:hypothetical protein